MGKISFYDIIKMLLVEEYKAKGKKPPEDKKIDWALKRTAKDAPALFFMLTGKNPALEQKAIDQIIKITMDHLLIN